LIARAKAFIAAEDAIEEEAQQKEQNHV
jgi:hypothetical protein